MTRERRLRLGSRIWKVRQSINRPNCQIHFLTLPHTHHPLHSAPEVYIGIDEAGRGPLLGPMTYSLAFWPASMDEELSKKGFDDSKNLSHLQRVGLWKKMVACPDVGWVLRVLQASEISRNMLRVSPYNLNAMSHDTAIDMIKRVMKAGVNVKKCFIDTVGIADNYRSKLESIFYGKGMDFIVESKADSTYKVVSASSICAKVSRDEIIEKWKWSEENYQPVGGLAFGSGYPSDPKCKTWVASNLTDPVFCFPDFVRFSWAPAKDALKGENVAVVKWEADDEDGNDDELQMGLGSFLTGGKKGAKRRKLGTFAVNKGFEYATDF
jgi:ribonuclease H2 subunit A